METTEQRRQRISGALARKVYLKRQRLDSAANPLRVDPSVDPRAEIARWMTELHKRGLLWHQDDDPADCLSAHKLPADQMSIITKSWEMSWEMAEAAGIDPHEIALATINA